MSTIDYSERIPNNVDLADDRRLQRALENWQPRFAEWWNEMGPAGFQDKDVYLRTAVDVGQDGWAHFGHVRMPDYRWGIFLSERESERTIGFGDMKGSPVWQEVPGEFRADLRRLGFIAGLGGAAAAMGFVSAMSLGVVVILGIQRLSGLPLLESVAIGMGGTILLMLLLLASAVSLFRKPFLRRSRLLLTRTWASLTRDDPDGPPPGGPASVAEA